MFYKLKCIECEAEFSEKETATNCLKCGEPLDCIYDFDQVKKRLNLFNLKNSSLSAMKYLAFYPILNYEEIVSLEEGGTPLLHAKNIGEKLGLKNIYIKNEGANPTGVFKDRGTLVEIAKAKEIGAKAICFASTGNMAASVAAYASIAKIPCYVLVPEGTPIGKLSQTLSYGARVIQVRGTYSDCAKLAEQMAKKYDYYLAGDYVFRGEGQKSQAYEIVEQLFWKSPDYVVCPIGCGTNFAAIWKGFVEFKQLGLIDKLPKLIGVQPVGCNVIVKAFNEGNYNFEVIDKPNTICSAVAAGNPLDGKKILRAMHASHGIGVEVKDKEALDAEQLMAKDEGVFIEPSGALPIAAVQKLAKEGFFNEDDMIVCIATGNGLKDPMSALKILPEPATIEPDLGEIDNFLKYKLYEIKSAGSDRKEVIWDKIDSKVQLKEILHTEFSANFDDKLLDGIMKDCLEFAAKGKKLSKADLQDIIEESLNELSIKDKVLEVLDFDVKGFMHKTAIGNVKVKIAGELKEETAEGVGIVDALITAIQKAINEGEQMEVRLTDYNVDISTGGVDATVKVTMKMEDKNQNKVVATATSPDVIVASINAFEKGYNILWNKNQ